MSAFCHGNRDVPIGERALLNMPGALLSANVAVHTDEALYRMAMVATDVLAVIEGRKPEYPVPPPI
jgi:hypothetical protein